MQRLAIRQRADLFEANISANKIILPQGQSDNERAVFQKQLRSLAQWSQNKTDLMF